jgi:hypothetical protein
MEVQLTPDQRPFVRQAIESERLRREEDAAREALFLWEERERSRAEILAAVHEAEAYPARGEGRAITLSPCATCRGGDAAWASARFAAEQQIPRR